MISKDRFAKIKAGDILLIKSGKKISYRKVVENHVQSRTIKFLKIKDSRYPSKYTTYCYHDLYWIIKGIFKTKHSNVDNKLNIHQIQTVIDWMNTWDQLKGTSIPIRFKEDFDRRTVEERRKAPPIGLKPKWVSDKERQGEIMLAISRYVEAGKTPPPEWAIEFHQLSRANTQ